MGQGEIRNLKEFNSFLNHFKKSLGAITLGLGLMSCRNSNSRINSMEMNRPANVIMLVADDMGWKDPGCYGNTNLETPHIDSLAEEGVLFENAFVVAPSCSPSRASLITGQYPHTNGVTALTHRYPKKSLKRSSNTLAKELNNAGYATAIDGKWHPAVFSPVRWFGYEKRMTGFGFMPGSWDIDDAEDAVGFIRKNQDRPFYLEMNFVQNHRIEHGKFYASEDHPVDPDSLDLPEHYALPDWPEIRGDVAKFYSQSMEMDAIIGDVLEEIERLELRESTMIVFLSDNGQPYPGAKITHYDRGIGTPLLVSWPGTLEGGQVFDELVSSIDIMPSILEANALPVPESVEGISFWPLITGQEDAPVRDAVYSEMNHHVHYIPARAVRTDSLKYIRNYSDRAFGLDELDTTDWAYRLAELPDQPWTRPRVQEELYDLAVDPFEQNNLAGVTDYAPQLDLMRGMLDDHMIRTEDPMRQEAFLHDYRPEDYMPD